MVTIYNSNDEINLNTYWEFRLKNDGLDCFRITYIRLNVN